MSFRREKIDVVRIPKTKTVIMTVAYSGDVSGPLDMSLLLCDAWEQYCHDNNVNSLETIDMVRDGKGRK